MNGRPKLATGPVTWGVDFADSPNNPPWTVVLDEIARSGINALELGPVGYLPEDPSTLREALESRRLTAVGSFVFEDFHDPAQAEHLASVTIRACRAIAAGGGSVLVIIDRPCPNRAATAGRYDEAPRLRGALWQRMLDRFEAAAATARGYGLRPVVHPHAGSFVEFEDEIERLIEGTSLDLCQDTGHAAYAGLDAAGALRSYAPRLSHVHLKDVRGTVLDQVRSHRTGFWDAIAQGVFCPLGDGLVDLEETLGALIDVGYEGYATIEQDRVPGSGTPLQELERSVAAIQRTALTGDTEGSHR